MVGLLVNDSLTICQPNNNLCQPNQNWLSHMEHTGIAGVSALSQLRALLSQQPQELNSRLPPERQLCARLGVTRTALRRALAKLEAEGQLWRHVGKGTFLGTRPAADLNDVRAISHRTGPVEVMRVRQLIEPEIARLAALNATASDIEEMRLCMRKSRAAANWREYESWDNRLHRTIATATQNSLLLAMFDMLNSVRRAVVWGRLRADALKPAADHHSFAEHEAIVAAIVERDTNHAAETMRRHLNSVTDNLLQRSRAA